jgi:hypothetical protein
MWTIYHSVLKDRLKILETSRSKAIEAVKHTAMSVTGKPAEGAEVLRSSCLIVSGIAKARNSDVLKTLEFRSFLVGSAGFEPATP